MVNFATQVKSESFLGKYEISGIRRPEPRISQTLKFSDSQTQLSFTFKEFLNDG